MQVYHKRCCIPGGTRVAAVIAVVAATLAAASALGAPAAVACPAPAPSSFGHSPSPSLEYVAVFELQTAASEEKSRASQLQSSISTPAGPSPGAEQVVPIEVASARHLAEAAAAEYNQVAPERIPFALYLVATDQGLSGAPIVTRASLANASGAAGPVSALREDLCRIYAGRIDIDPGKASLLALSGCAIMLVDRELYDQVNSGPRDPGVDRWGDVITNLGSGVATLGISGLVALRDPETGYLAANAVVYSGLSCAMLKAAFGRARPGLGEGPYAFSGPCIRDGYDSMPSGHTAAAFALATVLARRYPRYRVFFYAGATLVAVSRVYERAHWPSDTLVGAAVGVWSANQVLARSRLFEVNW